MFIFSVGAPIPCKAGVEPPFLLQAFFSPREDGQRQKGRPAAKAELERRQRKRFPVFFVGWRRRGHGVGFSFHAFGGFLCPTELTRRWMLGVKGERASSLSSLSGLVPCAAPSSAALRKASCLDFGVVLQESRARGKANTDQPSTPLAGCGGGFGEGGGVADAAIRHGHFPSLSSTISISHPNPIPLFRDGRKHNTPILCPRCSES